MNKKCFFGIAVLVLFLPIVVIILVYIFSAINIFNNPDFWYGYMAYFGTVGLAIVSLWQNDKLNQINKRIEQQQMRQNIGYFELERKETKNLLYVYKDLKMGEFYTPFGDYDRAKANTLTISLKNVGTDPIAAYHILSSKINDKENEIVSANTMIYKDESICFELNLRENEKYDDNLKVELYFKLQNFAGIVYYQHVDITAANMGDGEYRVTCFKSRIDFEEES